MSETPRGSAVAAARRPWHIWAVVLVALCLGGAAIYLTCRTPVQPILIPQFTIPVGRVRPPLADRIVSFHRAHFDRNLIQLASQLGFNGVQFQIEGPNATGIREFAQRDAREHIIDFCHARGMKVTVWVHELSDLPSELSPDYLGPVDVDNARIWDVIEQRYDWILGQELPNIDGLVLTCVETQFNATDTPIMLKLVDLIDRKCRQHGKELTVRTFVWHPEELADVMAAVSRMPSDIVIMSKVVPQDWQMRGGNAAEIGAVGGHRQIVEYDAAGEYFLSDNAANCMVDLLKRQFDYGLTKNVQGICVRVDRYDGSVLWEPNEVNLWALGMFASGATDDAQEIWNRWATYRYGAAAAPAVIAALKPTSEVIAEMLSVGPFTYGDTRGYAIRGRPTYSVPLPYDDIFSQNWQMWRWDASYAPALLKAVAGDPQFIADLRQQQAAAQQAAEVCLRNLEQAKALLPEKEYEILHTKLLTNKVQLAFRSQAALAALHVRQMWTAQTERAYEEAAARYAEDLAGVRAVSASLKTYPAATTMEYLGKTWQVNRPLLMSPEEMDAWVDQAARVPGR